MGGWQGARLSLTQQEDKETRPDPKGPPVSPFTNDRLVAAAAARDLLASQPLLYCLFSKGASWCPPNRVGRQI